MTVAVAVTDSAEGVTALRAAHAEARLRNSGLLIMNLGLTALDDAEIPRDVETKVVERTPHVDVGDHVLVVLDDHPEVDLLVIGMKRRSPVGKLVLGSLAQRLVLGADVPVLAVKVSGLPLLDEGRSSHNTGA